MGGKVRSAGIRAMRADTTAYDADIRSTDRGCRFHSCASQRQSRAGSFLEAAANVIVGYLVALAGQQVILPLFDLHLGIGAHSGIAALFTLLSLMRSYLLRRLFDHIAWQRLEEQRSRRQRLEQRFAQGSP